MIVHYNCTAGLLPDLLGKEELRMEWRRAHNSELTFERELQIVFFQVFQPVTICIHALFDTHSETRSLSAEHTHGNFQMFGLVVT